uniref:N-acylethanolamine-hydrolyzing acid amidase n=1 Tax=Acrobeloides nanus TaxID=290746 RepID=A0A914C8F8_9BILA
MWPTSILFLILGLTLILPINGVANELRTPKRYRISLDDPPEIRWNQVIDDHLDAIPAVIDEAKQYVPQPFQRILFWIAEKLIGLFPADYATEMRAIANRTGLPLGEVVGMNILYDITSFDRRHILGPFACTSIVAQDSKGNIFHGRNLDYDMGSLLKNITVIVDFVRNDTIVFTTTTFALYVGVLTGQRPHGYTISLNARYSGAYIDNIIMEFITFFKNPVSFEIRETLEKVETFDEAVKQLSRVHFVAPSYLIMGGVKPGEGAIITRNRWSSADVYKINIEKDRWFLLETNFDHWKKSDDDRRKFGIKFMEDVGRKNLNPSSLFSVLSKNPVNNKQTIFSSVMSAAVPELVYKFTKIRD